MILCIITPNFRPITEIIKELERERRSGRTDRQMDGRNDRRQYPSAQMAAGGNKTLKTVESRQ